MDRFLSPAGKEVPAVKYHALPLEERMAHRVVVDCSDLPSMTRQDGADDADINVIVRRYDATGQLPAPRPGTFADVTEMPDFRSALDMVEKGRMLFMQLPARVRAEFENDPANFVDAFNDPGQAERLVELGLVEAPEEPVEPAAKPAVETKADAGVPKDAK